MRHIITGFFLAAALLLLSLAPSVVMAKGNSIGIYAVVDQVTFDQDGPSPNTIRISGVFVLPVPMSSGDYKPPQRGYLYFRVPPGVEQAARARKDWAQLKTVAGTGRVVGFAFYWVPNPSDLYGNPHHSLEEVSVRTGGDAASPDVYPLSHPKGVVQAGDRSDFEERIAAELQNFELANTGRGSRR